MHGHTSSSGLSEKDQIELFNNAGRRRNSRSHRTTMKQAEDFLTSVMEAIKGCPSLMVFLPRQLTS